MKIKYHINKFIDKYLMHWYVMLPLIVLWLYLLIQTASGIEIFLNILFAAAVAAFVIINN